MTRLIPPIAAALILAAVPGFAQSTFVPGEAFLQQWDLNGDGKVTLAEAREQRGNIFAMFDADENGVYSADEIAMIDDHKAMERELGKGPGQAMGPGNGTRPRGMGGPGAGAALMNMPTAEGLRMFDANGDGAVDQGEFIAGTDAWFAMRDVNRDGVLNAVDFGAAR